MQKKISIMFVDDEQNALQGLQRLFRPFRHEWDMVFVDSAGEALKVLKSRSFDAIVSDMRMPHMNGAELLRVVCNDYPQMIRIILSGQADHADILKTVGPSHQYLSKPCDADALKQILESAFKLRDYLGNDSLRKLASQVDSLPSAPRLFMELMDAVKDPMVSLNTIGNIISRDVAMTAKVLKIVNSSYFGFSRSINTASEAVSYIGLDVIKSLVLSLQVFSQFDQNKIPELNFDSLFQHSLKTAQYAKMIVEAESDDKIFSGNVFIAGIIHDVGRLLLADHMPAKYNELIREAKHGGREWWELEQEYFGACHAQLGAYLVGLWGFPNAIVEALAFHHEPSKSFNIGFNPLTAVYVANALSQCCDVSESVEKTAQLDGEYLRACGVADKLEKWANLCVTSSYEEV